MEEIIIDGVNVKDCRRRIGKNSYCRYFKRPCAENNFNCIWKQNERLKEENKKLKEENHQLNLKKRGPKEKPIQEHYTKYRTLYMKYKHQQNNFEKITNQYKEVIRLLQAEIIQSASNEELFEKVEELNKLGCRNDRYNKRRN